MKDDKQRSGGRMWNLYKQGGITPALASMFGQQNAQQMAFIRSVMKQQRKQTVFDVPLKQLDVVVFDLETTGFSAYQGDEIISIGAVAVNGDQIISSESFYTLVNPRREIPVHIQKLTGISNEMVRDAPDLIDALHRFLDFVHRRVLVAHGSAHDKHFLNSALWKTSKTQLSHRMLDTMMIAKWLRPDISGYGLDEMLEAYGIVIMDRHHALQDSLMTADLYVRFVQEITDRQIVTLGDLYAYLSKR